MLSKVKNRKEQGFTIIEVLIVLAIAGLILLVVFLAVPALKRNSNNTAMKSDVQNLIGGITEFQANNDGKMPTSVSGTGDITISNGALTQTTKIRGATQVTFAIAAATPVAPAAGTPSSGNIHVMIGQKCDLTASTRSVATYYNIELSSGPSRLCQDG